MSKTICITYADDISRASGGANRVGGIIRGLVQQGYKVGLITLTTSHDDPEYINDIDVVTVDTVFENDGPQVHTQIERGIRTLRATKSYVRERNAIVQIEHSLLSGLAYLLNIDVDVVDMHDLCYDSPMYDRLKIKKVLKCIEGLGLRNAKSIVTVSDSMRRVITETWDLKEPNTHTIPNAYKSRFINSRAGKTVSGRVVFFGSLHPKLDTDSLIRISKLPEVNELLIIGKGARYNELKHASRENKKITMAGYLDDRTAYNRIASSQVAVNPQHQSLEQQLSCPVKLFYYAALGIPMVLTEGPDLVKELSQMGGAKVVESGGKFEKSVQELLTDEKCREQMSIALNKWANNHSWKKRSSEWESVYKGVSR